MLPDTALVRPAARRGRSALVGAVVMSAILACSPAPTPPAAVPATSPGTGPLAAPGAPVPTRPPFARDLEAYAGLGAWVDVFNYAPQYQPEGHAPPIGPADLDEMQRRGVKTVFLQATRWDDQSPGGYADEALLRAFLVHAHELGLRVVGWYLPRLVDPTFDIIRAKQIVDFRAGNERFDGLAVDIEYTEGEPDPVARSANLIAFSQGLRAAVPDEPIAAVILSAVHLEVVNTNFWPAFPYAEIGSSYDVWMPMAYWTIRLSPYEDGYRYAKESVDRLRADLGDPGALMAPIGGIADEMTDEHMDQFAAALSDVDAIGGSFYNWNTMAPGKQARAQELFSSGRASALPAPPVAGSPTPTPAPTAPVTPPASPTAAPPQG
jgi:hypothetical protein